MSISSRFRELAQDVVGFEEELKEGASELEPGARVVKKARNTLQEWIEPVGEIPRMKLEFKLTPVLLKAHNHLDRARLIFEEAGFAGEAAAAWDLQQKIYRLLNDL